MSYDDYTKAYLACDGTDGSTTFTDEIGHTFTSNGPVIDDAQYVFGQSGYWSGSGYLSCNHADFKLSTGAWAIEFRLRLFDTSQRALFATVESTDTHSSIRYDHANSRFAFMTEHNSNVVTKYISCALSINTWYAIAIVKDGDGVRVYRDGALVNSSTQINTEDLFSSNGFHIGRGYDGQTSFKGWMDEIRISKGTSRYVSDYIPLTYPFSGSPEPPPEFPAAAIQYKINPDIWMKQSPLTVSENDEYYISDEIVGGVEITNLDCHIYLGNTDKSYEIFDGSEQSYVDNRYTSNRIQGLKGGNTYVFSARVTIDGQIKTKKCEIRVSKENII